MSSENGKLRRTSDVHARGDFSEMTIARCSGVEVTETVVVVVVVVFEGSVVKGLVANGGGV